MSSRAGAEDYTTRPLLVILLLLLLLSTDDSTTLHKISRFCLEKQQQHVLCSSTRDSPERPRHRRRRLGQHPMPALKAFIFFSLPVRDKIGDQIVD